MARNRCNIYSLYWAAVTKRPVAVCSVYYPDFNSSSTDTGYLSVGILESSGYTVGDYVIEWRYGSYNGDVILISGSSLSAAPDVLVVHPFTDEIVPSGDLYPVIRFIEIDGTFYSYDGSVGEYAPDLKECLDFITVPGYTCDNGVYGNYSHHIVYNNTRQPVADATKIINFYISPTTGYFTWAARMYTVYDDIKFYYVSGEIETELEYWRIGGEAPNTNFTSYPKSWRLTTEYSGVIDITSFTYTSGDYIKIYITPNPTNYNTDWDISFGCLDVGAFTCDIFTTDWQTIDPCSVVGTWDSINCKLNVTWNHLGSISGNELTYFEWQGNNGLYDYNDSYTGINSGQSLRFNESSNTLSHGGISCSEYNDYVTLTKSGDYIEWSFVNSDDYDWFKNQYSTYISEMAVDYNSDPTTKEYYRGMIIYQNIAETCGDTINYKYMSHHYSLQLTFDDINKKAYTTLSEITNQYVDEDCSSVYETIQRSLYTGTSSLNYSYLSQVDGVWQTKVKNYIAWRDITSTVVAEDDVTRYSRILMYNNNMNNVCGGSMDGYCASGTTSTYEYYYKYNVRIVVTDTNDPENNFELYDNLDPITHCPTTTVTPIYKIVGGVRTIPVSCP